jgi:hypothetical protein
MLMGRSARTRLGLRTGKHHHRPAASLGAIATALGGRTASSVRLHLPTTLGALIALLSFAAALPAVASAAECTDTWTGPAEGTWQTAANWSAGHVPTSFDVACIGSGKTAKVTAGTNPVGVVQGEGTVLLSGATLEVSSGPATAQGQLDLAHGQ